LLTTDAAWSLLADVDWSLSMDIADPLMLDKAQSLVMDQDWSLLMDDVQINNQPNLLINDLDSTKPYSGPTEFHLLQCSKQRNFKYMKKNLVKTKTANFKRSCLCSMLTHEQMTKLRSNWWKIIL